MFHFKWALTRENLSFGGCKQDRRRLACIYAQSDQRFVIHLLDSAIRKLASGKI